MTLEGTKRANRKGIPKELVEMKNEDDMMLTSYVVKKKCGKRNILLLSTMHDDVRSCRD